jgi:hypothetical protein
MTDAEREQVVEILRCCADTGWTWVTISIVLDASDRVFDFVSEALDQVWVRHEDYQLICLEAAQRAEERSWP